MPVCGAAEKDETLLECAARPITAGAIPMSAEPPELQGDAKRQAVASIRGHVYQAWASIEAWLRLTNKDQIIFLEGAEDFDVVSSAGAIPIHSRTAKAKSSPGCRPTAPPANPGSRSTTPSGNSTATMTGWWSAGPSWASTPKPALPCAPTSKGPTREAIDPLRPASRVRTFQAGA